MCFVYVTKNKDDNILCNEARLVIQRIVLLTAFRGFQMNHFKMKNSFV